MLAEQRPGSRPGGRARDSGPARIMPFAGSKFAGEVSAVRERVTAWPYLVGWAVVCRMPRRWAEWMFGAPGRSA